MIDMEEPTEQEIQAAFDKAVMQPLGVMLGASLGDFSKAGGFASGGYIKSGKPYIVGETARETIMRRAHA